MTARRGAPAPVESKPKPHGGFGSLVPGPERLAVAEERLLLHELMRVGVARQEDLKLLQTALSNESIPAASCQTLIQQCSLREEWRCQREQQLLGSIGITPLASCGDRDSQQQLMDQLCALKQIEEEHHAMMLRRVKKQRHMPGSFRSNRGQEGLSSTARPAAQGMPPRSPLNDRPRTTASLPRPVTSSGPAPLSPYGAPPPRTAGAPLRPSSLQGEGAAGPQGRRPSPSPSPSPYAMSVGSRPTTGQGGQGRAVPGRSLTDTANRGGPASSSGDVGRPISAPTDFPAVGSSPRTTTAGGKQRSTSSNLDLKPYSSPGVLRNSRQGSGPGPAGVGAAALGPVEGGWSSGGARFQQLYRLHGTLLKNLEDHKAASGSQGATSALEANIVESQQLFVRCLQEAADIAEEVQREQEAEAMRGAAGRPGTRGGGRAPSWERLLRLGQLGLTATDVERLGQLRRAQAARVIQRAARQWLRLRAHQRAVREAQQRVAAIQARLRFGAALIIQCCWRGYTARKAAARLRAHAALEARQARVLALRRNLAATRIQAAWRKHRKRVRARQALGLAANTISASSARAAAAAAASGRGPEAGREKGAGLASAAQGGRQAQRGQDAGPKAGSGDAGSSGSGGCGIGGGGVSALLQNPTPQMQRSATLIQACVRGWLVRRSQELSWCRSLAGLRGRRATAAAWAAHQQRMMHTFQLQQQMVEVVLQEADAAQAAVRGAERERLEFESAWGAWLGQQLGTAMMQPLPRGWVPQPDPAAGNIAFLNTRTGELHAFHPSVQQLRGFVAQQRQVAEAKQTERELRVAAHLDAMHRRSVWEQAQLLRRMEP